MENSSPFVKFKILDAVAVFTLGADDDPATVENVDVQVLADGSRWSATFLTLRELDVLMERWKESGESHAGAYLRVPDLIVIREPGLAAMVAVLEGMVRDKQIYQLSPLPPLEDDDEEDIGFWDV